MSITVCSARVDYMSALRCVYNIHDVTVQCCDGCRSVFGAKSEYTVKRLSDSEGSDSEESSAAKHRRLHKPTASSTKV